jgi:DNA-binding NarL/FixJ family response regulator
MMLNKLANGKMITGLWDETIFPTIKNLIKYGADKFMENDTHKDVIDAAVDAAALTIGTLAPSLLPHMLGLKQAGKDVAHTASNQLANAIRDWAIRGHMTMDGQMFDNGFIDVDMS